MSSSKEDPPKPDHIMELGFGFFASKALLTAVKLGVFDALANGAATREELQGTLNLHPRSSADFLDALVALGVLDREDGRYRNTPETEAFLVSGRPSYIGGLLEMANDRLYPFWGDLEEALRTGRPTNELDDEESHPFEEAIYEHEERLEQFVGAMTGLSMGAANVLAEEFPWEEYETVVDLGTRRESSRSASPRKTGTSARLAPICRASSPTSSSLRGRVLRLIASSFGPSTFSRTRDFRPPTSTCSGTSSTTGARPRSKRFSTGWRMPSKTGEASSCTAH